MYDPGRKALPVKDTPGDKQPSIGFNAKTGSHAPLKLGNEIRDANVSEDGNMMLNDDSG